MHFDGALVKEQGVTFGIVIVKSHVLNIPGERDEMVSVGHAVFGPVPIVLMKQDRRGTPTYWGRDDIVRCLARVDPRRIPWKRYTLSAG